MRFLKSLSLLACTAACMAAEAPDAKSLLLNSSKAPYLQGSLKLEQQLTIDMQGSGMNNKMTMVVKMASMPGKFSMEMAPMGVRVVSDSQFTYIWLAPLNQYMKKPAAGSPEGLAESMMPGAGAMMGKMKDAITSAKILREETVDLQGKKVDCYVVEATIGKMTMPGPTAVTVNNSHQTVWIDKDRKLALKQIADMEMQMSASAEPMKMHQEMAVTSLDLAPAFADDQFTFTPPAGAKLVEKLPGMPQ